MGGMIGLQSTPGEGSSFWFSVTLPLAVETHSEPEAAQPLSLRPLSVLLAEDNAVNRKVAEAILQHAGHKVRSVGDGRQAVEAAAEDRFDLILMDMQMPEMDGLEAARKLRQAGCSLPIVALTANALHEDRERCREAGMDGYVPKPFTPDGLFAEMARVIRLRDAA